MTTEQIGDEIITADDVDSIAAEEVADLWANPPVIYRYHSETGEFLESGAADPSPIEPGVFIIDAYATTVAPPEVGPQEAAVFVTDAWQVKADFRDVPLYSTETGGRIFVNVLGPQPINTTTQEPPSIDHKWQQDAWVLDDEARRDRLLSEMSAAVQRHIDEVARQHEFDSILSMCSYADDPDPVFAAQGQAARVWRSAVWTKCREVRDAVLAGTREAPTEAELIAELPVLQA